VSHVLRQKQIHRLRHIIAELAAKLPGDIQASPQVREMASYGCRTRMHVVQLLAPGVEAEDHTKDIDFSRAGIRSRWQAGYIDTKKMIEAAPWEAEVTDPEEGFYLHALRSVG
jgi:NTE family protein